MDISGLLPAIIDTLTDENQTVRRNAANAMRAALERKNETSREKAYPALTGMQDDDRTIIQASATGELTKYHGKQSDFTKSPPLLEHA